VVSAAWGDYGTVGTWPAFSWASRAALSPASWAAFSLEWKVPGAGAVPVPGVVVDGVEALALGLAAAVAAWVTMKPPAKAPVISPTAVAATAARRPLRPNRDALWGAGGGGGGISVLSMSLSMVEGPLVVSCLTVVAYRKRDGSAAWPRAGVSWLFSGDLADDAMLVTTRADSLSTT
jgi:hypothetical protein